MAEVIKKCIELNPHFLEFLKGEINLTEYKKISKPYSDQVKEIVHYQHEDLEVIQKENTERKYRENTELLIDSLIEKKTLECLVEARKVFEANQKIIRKHYKFDQLLLNFVSTYNFKNFDELYGVNWPNIVTILNNHLLNLSKNLDNSEAILKNIKFNDENADIFLKIVKLHNEQLNKKLLANYDETQLKLFKKDYDKYSFYEENNKSEAIKCVKPIFLQRRIYAYYYLDRDATLFLELLKKYKKCIQIKPRRNDVSFYRAIIESVKLTNDFSFFRLISKDIISSNHFKYALNDVLRNDEETIRNIVGAMKGKENQLILERFFLDIYKKELILDDMETAPSFNKKNAEVYMQKYHENEEIIKKSKAKHKFFEVLSIVELVFSVILGIAVFVLAGIPFAFKLYLLGALLMIIGLGGGILTFVYFRKIIVRKTDQRLGFLFEKIQLVELENIIILRKVYLGID